MKLLLRILPFAIIAGILDYRFHNYFWPWGTGLRSGFMFDFASVFEFFAVFFVGFALWKSRKKLPPLPRWLWAALAALFLGIVVSGLSYEPVEPRIQSWIFQVGINYALPIAVAGAALLSWKREEFERWTLGAFTALGSLSILEFLTDWLPGANQDFLGRLVWPYIDPFVGMNPESANWLAFVFGPIVILAALRLTKKPDLISSLAFFVGAGVMLLSQSYTGIGVLGGILAYLIFVKLPRKWKAASLVGALLALGIFVATQYDSPKFQILRGDYDRPNSIERRVQIYTFTWESFKEDPLGGIGAGNYQSYFRENQGRILDETIPEIELPPHPHNLLGKWWADLGLFGVAALALIYAASLWQIFRWQNLAYLPLAYPLAHGLLDTPYGLMEVSVLFWLWLAFAVDWRHELPARLHYQSDKRT
jgi:O-antigen ligase